MSKTITALSVLLITLALMGCGKSSSVADNNKDVAQATIQAQSESGPNPNVAAIVQFITDKNNAGKFADSARDADSVLVVFNFDRQRYTIWHARGDFPPNPQVKGPWLFFSIQPESRKDLTPPEAFVCDRNGLIIVAEAGGKGFVNKPDIQPSTADNTSREYWQKRVDEAIRVTLKHIDKPNSITTRGV